MNSLTLSHRQLHSEKLVHSPCEQRQKLHGGCLTAELATGLCLLGTMQVDDTASKPRSKVSKSKCTCAELCAGYPRCAGMIRSWLKLVMHARSPGLSRLQLLTLHCKAYGTNNCFLVQLVRTLTEQSLSHTDHLVTTCCSFSPDQHCTPAGDAPETCARSRARCSVACGGFTRPAEGVHSLRCLGIN
jgi:hypothetical protein